MFSSSLAHEKPEGLVSCLRPWKIKLYLSMQNLDMHQEFINEEILITYSSRGPGSDGTLSLLGSVTFWDSRSM